MNPDPPVWKSRISDPDPGNHLIVDPVPDPDPPFEPQIDKDRHQNVAKYVKFVIFRSKWVYLIYCRFFTII